ncbi:LLM class flavin-dependent oxidoreductase [Cellulomonas soli]|uniref:N5,N10-methylene tetrahydromethanopterin reductase n=1 Tax=Cellulomonas soli TaxID=931535 RepID=A0A512PIS7_9CELL|nr:LLM class flavin-dependent oxidoreductase [Cellulomonas soli]NYI58842.1 alkanesulfonate monooxygenase SsuD/methylene tetrahydromethanopterin reductase-like flavin-dependent oxidoreductase (luciferase family) [Cellulomonas soli]GEP71083.1 N5,N10-methylene tetrahydromethanopterin reductase [Cellulomonas soli]
MTPATSKNTSATPSTRTGSIGVMLPRDLPAADVLRFAQRADELGFDELWVVEDLGFRGGFAQAAATLAVTPRIVVGIGILPTGARQVAYTAMELNTLAELFPGRVVAGIGHGMPGWMRQLGVWPASPLTLLDEQATALHGLLRGEAVTLDGRYVHLADVRLDNPAPQPPLVLAGVRGPKSLALAGRVTDGVVLAEPATPEYIAATLGHLGDGPGRHVVTYDVACVDDDADRARATVRPALEWIGEPDWAPHLTPLPFAAEFAALRAASADRAAFAEALPDVWVDRLAVVGTPAEARASIDARHAAGAATTVLIAAGPDPFAALDGLARVL